MILGNLLAKENKLVTSSWVYSTELRLVYQQLFYMPLFKLFDNWHLVRTITILLNTIVLLASYFFMMRQFDVSKKTALLTSLFLILPVSYGYWSFVLFGGYYIFFIAMFFCYIGVSAILIKTDGQNTSIKKRNTAFIFFALLAFTFGLGGVRGPMDIQAPMFITALCVYFPQKNTVLNSKPFLLGIAGLLLCAVGYAINSVLHLFLHFAFQIGKDTVDLSGIFFQRLGDILYNFILFLGYTADVKFISAQGVLNFAVVIIAFLVFYEAIRIIKTRRANDVSALNVSFVLFFMVATVYHVVLFQIIEYISRYLYPTYILYVPTLAIVFEFVRKNMPRKKAAIFVSGIVFVILCSGMIKLYSLPDIDNNNHRKSSISYLEENNLRFGFASLWNGNIITELTNGRIETLGLHPDNYHKMSGWLYPVAYRNPDYHTGETFLLLTRDEWQGDEKLLRRVPDYEDDYFVIFKYPSAAQVFEEIITEN
jgi:hypothetical protein